MINNLKNLINQYGAPDALIDNWDEELIGYAVWGFEESIIWNDPYIDINWPLKILGFTKPILSSKDASADTFKIKITKGEVF